MSRWAGCLLAAMGLGLLAAMHSKCLSVALALALHTPRQKVGKQQ